jgi:hypothetical protein
MQKHELEIEDAYVFGRDGDTLFLVTREDALAGNLRADTQLYDPRDDNFSHVADLQVHLKWLYSSERIEPPYPFDRAAALAAYRERKNQDKL